MVRTVSNPLLEDSTLDFVASIILAHETKGVGEWWSINDETKNEYRIKARQTVDSWKVDQENKRIKFVPTPRKLKPV